MSAFHADALDVPGGRERGPARVPETPHTPTRAETVRALQGSAGNQAVARMLRGRATGNALQRWEGEVMDRARGQADAEREYAQKTAELEFKLGQHLSPDPVVNEIANTLVTRLKQVVDAWATAIGKDRKTVYGTEFAFPDGQKYYGSFKTTGEEIAKVLDSIQAQPLRKKLNVTYYCVRNSSLAKWLEAAALEIVQASTAPLQVKDASAGGAPTSVAPGFAQASGLKDLWGTGPKTGPGELTPQQIADTATQRHPTEPVPTIGERSNILGSQEPTNKSRNDKAYEKSTGLNWDEQATITRGDVPDISVEELKLLYARKGGDPATRSEAEWLQKQAEYKNKPTKQVRWETGLGSIEVLPGSHTRQIADKFRARIDGGISGSTDLMMHAAVHLGVTSAADKKHLRLALVAWMLSNKDHSFFEIMHAAEGYGVPFHLDDKRPGAEYEHEDNFAPLPKSRVQGFKDLMSDKRMPSEVFAGGALDQRAEGKRDTRSTPASAEAAPDVLLTNLGVAATSLTPGTTDSAFVAHHEAFSAAVLAAQIGDSTTEDGLRRSRVAVQKLREDISFQWLGVHHKDGAVYVDALLEQKLEARQPGTLVTVKQLTDIGVPDAHAQKATPAQRLDLKRLALALRDASKPSAPTDAMTKLRLSLPFLAANRMGGTVAEDTISGVAAKLLTGVVF